MARSWEFEPKIRSTRVPVHLISPVARSRPSYTPSDVEEGCHFVFMSSRLTKKSFVNVPGRLVKTPFLDCPKLAFRARRPPFRTVIQASLAHDSNCFLVIRELFARRCTDIC